MYAKGADYSPERLPEAATVREVGARLALLPLAAGHSTSGLVRALALGRQWDSSPRSE